MIRFLIVFLFFSFSLFSIPFSGITLETCSELPASKKELDDELSIFLGENLNKKTILQIKEKILQFYKKHGRPFVEVQIPPQKIEAGLLVCTISEKVVGEVVASPEVLRHLHVRQDAPINVKELSKDLQWINHHHFRKVNAIITPGREGKNDLTFHMEEKRPIKVYSGFFEDSLIGGFHFGGLPYGQVFSYQGTYGFDEKKTFAHSFHYELPFPNKSSFVFSGGYSQMNKGVDAKTIKLDMRYKIDPFSVGLNGKRLHLHFLSGEESYLMQFFAGYELHIDKRFDLSIELIYSPSSFHTKQMLIYSAPSNLIAKVTIDSRLSLPFGITWKNSCFLQGAIKPLLFSEQIGIGGASSVRGYSERMFGGNQGVIVNSELVSKTFHIFSKDAAQALLFFDYGYARGMLASIGSGFRYWVDPYFTLKFDIGVPLVHKRGVGVHFSALFSY